MPKRFKWSPNNLTEQMARLLDAGWEAIAYWCERPSAQKTGFIVAGRNPGAQAQASEALKRVHAEGGMPSMLYQVSLADDPPSVEDEICRLSRDGITVIASDFTGLAARCMRMNLSTRADIVQEELEKCGEIIETLVQRRDAFRARS